MATLAPPPMPPSPIDEDVALVEELRGGRREAMESLWRRHAGMVRGILRRMLGPDQDVEDLLQDTFIHFFRQLPSLRDPRALRMFLITIATNTARGELRMRRVRRWVKPTASGALPDIPTHGEDDMEARQALHRFYGILDRLSPYDRTAFVLRFVEDLDLVDVAAAVGVSLATIKRHLTKVAAKVYAEVNQDHLLADFLSRKGLLHAT
jgi:RNA polymerase sigma-70 factor (ECF subfamily)